jgi:hypothetical protein
MRECSRHSYRPGRRSTTAQMRKTEMLLPAVHTPYSTEIGAGHVPRFSPGFVQVSGSAPGPTLPAPAAATGLQDERKGSASEDAAVQCGTRSGGATGERPPRLARVDNQPTGCKACRAFYLTPQVLQDLAFCSRQRPQVSLPSVQTWTTTRRHQKSATCSFYTRPAILRRATAPKRNCSQFSGNRSHRMTPNNVGLL